MSRNSATDIYLETLENFLGQQFLRTILRNRFIQFSYGLLSQKLQKIC